MCTSGHVLVAEDNSALLGVIELSLRNAGFKVTTAATGLKAWDVLQAEEFDLVLADFNMPGMNGGTLCEAMRNDPRHRATPIVLLTALSADIQRDERYDFLDVATIIRKPFSPRDMVAKVARVLRQHRERSTTPAAVSGNVPISPNTN